MNRVNLDRFVDAYRDACNAPLDDTTLKRRINRTLRERAATNRQRPWLWLFGLGGMLTASLASATPAGQQVMAWLQKQIPRLEQRQDNTAANTPALAVGKPRPARVRLAEPVEPPEPSTDLAMMPASLGDDVAPTPTKPTRVRTATPSRAPKAEPLALNPPTKRGDDTTALYEHAFQLQFSRGNYRGALDAWDKYLFASKSTGALVGEAQFHRAVCLVALGRHSEARSALTKIANGAGGAAYRARAHTLLQAMESAAKR